MHKQNDTQVGARAEAQACLTANTLPDKVACGWACARRGALSDERVFGCEKGLSPLQINVLALVSRLGARIKPYAYLARLLNDQYGMLRTPESVRGVVNRLAVRGFLRHRQAREGTLRGVCFTVIDELLCPSIMGVQTPPLRDSQHGTHSGERQGFPSVPSILKEKDRKNLSISINPVGDKARLEALTEEDMKFHWPKLSDSGFGTHQIRQVIERLEQKNIPLSNVLQGLGHAEWELDNGLMKDKDGKPVEHPTNWLFFILARQGYYPRPSGYVSPQEQAELDKAREQKALQQPRRNA